MLGVRLTRRTLNKPLFGICSGSPQSHMPRLRSHTDVDIPLQCYQGSTHRNSCCTALCISQTEFTAGLSNLPLWMSRLLPGSSNCPTKYLGSLSSSDRGGGRDTKVTDFANLGFWVVEFRYLFLGFLENVSGTLIFRRFYTFGTAILPRHTVLGHHPFISNKWQQYPTPFRPWWHTRYAAERTASLQVENSKIRV